MLDTLFEMFRIYSDAIASKHGGLALALFIRPDASGRFVLYGNAKRDILFDFSSLAEATNTFKIYVKEL